jgi:hypothetical protein
MATECTKTSSNCVPKQSSIKLLTRHNAASAVLCCVLSGVKSGGEFTTGKGQIHQGWEARTVRNGVPKNGDRSLVGRLDGWLAGLTGLIGLVWSGCLVDSLVWLGWSVGLVWLV